jgi:hypothetical protein
VVDARPSQSALRDLDHLIHADPLVERFERWALWPSRSRFSLDDAAGALATSKRTSRAPPAKIPSARRRCPICQDLRVEHAVHLLKTTDHSIERIATLVGTPTALPAHAAAATARAWRARAPRRDMI